MNCKDKVKGIIASMSVVSAAEINTDDSLRALGIDSLKMVELIVQLEDNLEITFDDSELDPGQLVTVASVIELTEKYLMV